MSVMEGLGFAFGLIQLSLNFDGFMWLVAIMLNGMNIALRELRSGH